MLVFSFIVLNSLLFLFNCLTSFTLEVGGGYLVTTKFESDNDWKSIAITEKGTIIKFNPDSSINSTIEANSDLENHDGGDSHLCQLSNSEFVLTRNKKIIIYKFGTPLNIITTEVNDKIESLSCHKSQKEFIVSYPCISPETCKYKIGYYKGGSTGESCSFTEGENSDDIKSISCSFLGESKFFCIYNKLTETNYIYYKTDPSCQKIEGQKEQIDPDQSEERYGGMIKSFSDNKILMCQSVNQKATKINSFLCSISEVSESSGTVNINLISQKNFNANQNIKNEDILKYCEMEIISSSPVTFVTVCLKDFSVAKYSFSIQKLNGNQINEYSNSPQFNNIELTLMGKTPISLIGFENDSIGLFYKKKNGDSEMIIFYPKCGNVFDLFPKPGSNICQNRETIESNLFFDDCTHSFKNLPVGYSSYEKDNFCDIVSFECALNYGLAPENKNECWNKITVPNRYFYNESGNEVLGSKFFKCHKSCKTCGEKGTDLDTKCLSCDDENEYYPLEDKNTQCHYRYIPIEKYYFDDTTSQFKKCSEGCLLCNEIGDNDDTKCKVCDKDNNYYPQIDKMTNCLKNDRTDVQKYFYNPYSNFWEQCFTGCLYCNELGFNSNDTKCDNSKSNYCDTSYYTVIDKPGNCFKNNEHHDYYYYDSVAHIFKKCNIACKTCEEFGPAVDNTKCISCNSLEDYYPIEENGSINNTICYKKGTIPVHYYFGENNFFKRCFNGCRTCKKNKNANVNNTQCISCDDDYYMYKPTSEKAERSELTCYKRDTIGFYFNTSDNYMYKCPEWCYSCSFESILDNKKCIKCDNDNDFYQLEEKMNGQILDKEFKICVTKRPGYTPSISGYGIAASNTVLLTHIFNRNNILVSEKLYKYCSSACKTCTNIEISSLNTNCEAKQCNSGFIYVLSHESICYRDTGLIYHSKVEETNRIYHFEPCYETCETCKKSGTKHNNFCNSCRKGFIFHPNKEYADNCVFDCLVQHQYYYLKDEDYICTDICPSEKPYIQPDRKECIDTCKNEPIKKYSLDRICIENCPEGTIPDPDSLNCTVNTRKCFKSEITSHFDITSISKNPAIIDEFAINYCKDYFYTSQEITFIKGSYKDFTLILYKNPDCVNGKKEKDFKDFNLPDLTICFSNLRNYYNIPQKEPLIIMVMNIQRENATQVEYKIFNSKTCLELNLEYCNKEQITTLIDMNQFYSKEKIKEAAKMSQKGVNVYNEEDKFFNDICYNFTSDNGEDIILEDRIDFYYQNILKICENKCSVGLNFEKEEINCTCKIKKYFLEDNYFLTHNESKNAFNNGTNYVSSDVLKCSEQAFNFNFFKNNIGSFTSLVLIVAELPSLIYFMINGLDKIKEGIIPFMHSNPPKIKNFDKEEDKKENEIFETNDYCLKETMSNEEKKQINQEKGEKFYYENYKGKELKEISEVNEDDSREKESIITENQQKINYKTKYQLKGKSKNCYQKDMQIAKPMYSQGTKYIPPDKQDIYKEIFDYDDINEVELYDAITFDKRTFFEYYWEELKRTQPVIETFFNKTPFSPFYFKLLIFIFQLALCFELNALFYSKNYISKKFYSLNTKKDIGWYCGKIYDRILIVCFGTIILSLFIKCITSKKRRFQFWFKREKNSEKLIKELNEAIKSLKTIYIIYLVIQELVLFFIWYHLTCFCNCYKNNKKEWFVTSLICYGIIQIWYFISTFIVACLRFLGLKYGMESCYNASLCLSID